MMCKNRFYKVERCYRVYDICYIVEETIIIGCESALL